MMAALLWRHHHRARFLGRPAEGLGRRPRNGLGEVEQARVLPLAEILGAEQLRQANDVGARAPGFPHPRDRTVEVLRRLGRHRHLHETDLEARPHLASLT